MDVTGHHDLSILNALPYYRLSVDTTHLPPYAKLESQVDVSCSAAGV